MFKNINAVMENQNISGRVRIRFKKQPEMIEGHLIFTERQEGVWHDRSCFALFTFRLNDGMETEKIFKTIDVERIDYLRD